MSNERKPVLWLSLTSEGRHSSDESLARAQQQVEEAVGDEYEVIAADDKVRLLDAEEIRDLIQQLQEHAAKFSHEDAMLQAMGGEEQEEDDA